MFITTRLLIVLLYILVLSHTAITQIVPRFEYADTSIIDLPRDQKIKFGYLVVLEDRSMPNGRTLRLPVFILKCRNPNPKQDPALYTAGGPGSSSVNNAKYGAYYSYLDDRDFLVFEQRGTRYAQPSLACPELDSIKLKAGWIQLNDAQRKAEQVAAAARCQTRLVNAGIMLSAYSTRSSAQDIEDLRTVLGVEQFNVYTVSYSTKIAQVLLRDYPNSIRSAVLDSPLPLWSNYDETSLLFFEEKLNLLFSACEGNPACKLSYPDLKKRFLEFMKHANTSPVWLRLKSPIDSSFITVSLKGYQIASFINLGETYNLKGLPRLLDRLCRGDYEVLKPFVYSLFSAEGRSMGMRLSVWCSEEYLFEKLNAASRLKGIPPQYRGMRSEAIPLEICSVWKVVPATAKENQAFKTTVPVLLLNGAFDPDTPAAWGEQLHREFLNSYHFVFKGMSHTPAQNWDNNCGMQLAQSFFNEPTKKPDLRCFRELKNIAFDTKK